MNYIGSSSSCRPNHRITEITDCSDVAVGDYLINKWHEGGWTNKINVCYIQIVSRTNKFITITEKDQFVKLSWNEQDKYWGKNQGYRCRTYIKQDELPEGLETID